MLFPRHLPGLLTPALCISLTGAALLLACGGGADGSSSKPSGTVSGLTAGGLVLASGSGTQSVAAGATSFAFDTSVSDAGAVSVLLQPDGQTCAVVNGTTVAVTCRGYMAYVANNAGGSIAQFSVGSDGALTALTPATLGTTFQPSAIAVSLEGSHAWVDYRDDQTVSSLNIATSGQLSVQSTSARAATAGYALTLSPTGKSLYALNYGGASISQFTIDSTGRATAMASPTVGSGLAPYAMALTPNGAYAYVANASDDSLSQYNVGTSGALAAMTPATLATGSAGSKPEGMAAHPAGAYLYVTLAGSAKLAVYGINAATGGLSYLSSQSTGTTPRGIAVSPNGAYVYVANYGSGTVSQFSVAGASLTPMATRTVAAGSSPNSVAVSPDGRYLYVTNAGDGTVSQYTIGSGGTLVPMAQASVASGGLAPAAIAVR